MSNETPSVCGNCRFWGPFKIPGTEHHGFCRRHPPSVSRMGEHGRFPISFSDAWCGEYQRKQSVAQGSEPPTTSSGDQT